MTEENKQITTFKEPKTIEEIATNIANSNLVPAHFRNPANAMIAAEIAKRLNTDIFSVVQNLYIVNGKPSWSSSFIASLINRCGRFKPLKYKYINEKGEEVKSFSKDVWGCYAYTKEIETGEDIEGTLITMDIAKKEGWLSKSGSKWQSMSAQMLTYRAATFFGRQHLPEYLNSMQTVDELEDIKTISGTVIDSEAERLNNLFINNEGE